MTDPELIFCGSCNGSGDLYVTDYETEETTVHDCLVCSGKGSVRVWKNKGLPRDPEDQARLVADALARSERDYWHPKRLKGPLQVFKEDRA